MKPIPIAFSILERFKNCPKQFHDVKVVHDFEDTPNELNLWGDHVHKQFKVYLDARGEYLLPPDVIGYKPYLDKILKLPGTMYPECKLAVNTKLEPCGFFDSNVFMRGIIDVLHVNGTAATALDHKTGKKKMASQQMKMAALLIMLVYKHIESVRVAFSWLKVNQYDSDEFTREQIQYLWNEFIPEIKQYKEAFDNDTWPAKQSGLCKGWCPVQSCQFWEPKKIRK
jgi:hypothetical protein